MNPPAMFQQVVPTAEAIVTNSGTVSMRTVDFLDLVERFVVTVEFASSGKRLLAVGCVARDPHRISFTLVGSAVERC